MFFNEAWFIHGVNGAVQHLAQQKVRRTEGACELKEGVTGKTWPFNLMGAQEWQQVTGRDQPTTYINPPQSKVRASLVDFDAFALVDTLDEIRELADPRAAVTQALVYGRNRTLDARLLRPLGLTPAGVAGTQIGGILGLKTTVDEAAESTGLVALPTTQQIVHADQGLTVAKIATAKLKMDNAGVDEEDRYLFISPFAMNNLLTDTTVTSQDYNTIRVLNAGQFPMDGTWYGFRIRQTIGLSTQLDSAKVIRNCIAVQKMAVGMAVGLITALEVDKAVHMRNNWQVGGKLSAGAVRKDDSGVVQIDVRES